MYGNGDLRTLCYSIESCLKNEGDVLDFVEVVIRETAAGEWEKLRKLHLAKGSVDQRGEERTDLTCN